MSGLGRIHPRRPARTSTAGNKVTAARNATAMETAKAGPTVEKTPSRVNTMPKKVTATVAAEATITLPMDGSALVTASSEAIPSRKYSW